MSEVVHLERSMLTNWCDEVRSNASIHHTPQLAKATCLQCLLACAEYGSEARHRYEVCRESGAKP